MEIKDRDFRLGGDCQFHSSRMFLSYCNIGM